MCVVVARLDNEDQFSLATIDNCSGMTPANQALWHWFNRVKNLYGEPSPKNFSAYLQKHNPCMIAWCRYQEGLALIDAAFDIKVGTGADATGNIIQTFVSEFLDNIKIRPLHDNILAV